MRLANPFGTYPFNNIHHSPSNWWVESQQPQESLKWVTSISLNNGCPNWMNTHMSWGHSHSSRFGWQAFLVWWQIIASPLHSHCVPIHTRMLGRSCMFDAYVFLMHRHFPFAIYYMYISTGPKASPGGCAACAANAAAQALTLAICSLGSEALTATPGGA